jgi:hypothetical protein
MTNFPSLISSTHFEERTGLNFMQSTIVAANGKSGVFVRASLDRFDQIAAWEYQGLAGRGRLLSCGKKKASIGFGPCWLLLTGRLCN